MQRKDMVDTVVYGGLIQMGFKLGSLAKDATANMTIQTTWPPVLYLDPAGGTKTILLPAEADSKELVFFIVNTADAAESLTVKDDAGASTIVTIAQNGFALVHCTGTAWSQIL